MWRDRWGLKLVMKMGSMGINYDNSFRSAILSNAVRSFYDGSCTAFRFRRLKISWVGYYVFHEDKMRICLCVF